MIGKINFSIGENIVTPSDSKLGILDPKDVRFVVFEGKKVLLRCMQEGKDGVSVILEYSDKKLKEALMEGDYKIVGFNCPMENQGECHRDHNGTRREGLDKKCPNSL